MLPTAAAIRAAATAPPPQGSTRYEEVLHAAIATLRVHADMPLRLDEIEQRFDVLLVIGDVTTSLRDEVGRLSPTGSKLFFDLHDLRTSQTKRLQNHRRDAEVVADAWTWARTEFARRWPTRQPSTERVMTVVQAEPDWEIREVILGQIRVAPKGRHWLYSLVCCERWFYELLESALRDTLDPYEGSGLRQLLSAAVPVDADEVSAIAALWDDDPLSIYFDVATALDAVRLIG